MSKMRRLLLLLASSSGKDKHLINGEEKGRERGEEKIEEQGKTPSDLETSPEGPVLRNGKGQKMGQGISVKE